LISLLTLVFLILGSKDIRGGLTFYTWVSQAFYNFDFWLILILRQVTFTLSNMFSIRNPIVKLWRAMFSNSPTKDGQITFSSRPEPGLRSNESIQKQVDPESSGGGVTPDTQQPAPALFLEKVERREK
jgi:hypothetical protein